MSQGKLQTPPQLQRARTVVLMGPRADLFPPAALLEDSFLIGVDGGTWDSHAQAYHLTLGDGDSAAPGVELQTRHPVDKDQSDLALALALLPPTLECLHLWGFWGGRDDHHLMNLGELFLAPHLPAQTLIHRPGLAPVRLLPPGTHELSLAGTFSLFSLSPALFTLAGACRYPVRERRVAPLSSQLLSNRGDGVVQITCDQRFFCLEETP